MRLSDLNLAMPAEQGVAITLTHPVTEEELTCDDGTPMTITIVGHDSPTFKKTARQIAARQGNKKATPELTEKNLVELMAACTIGWNLQLEEDSKLKFSQSEARDLYSDQGFTWIREQVASAMQDRSLFLPK